MNGGEGKDMLANLRRRRRVKAFIRGWTLYRDLLPRVAAADGTPADAARLLALQGHLAAELQVIAVWTPPTFAAEGRKIHRQITALLGGRLLGTGSDTKAAFDAAEFQRAWNEVFIALNKLLGALAAAQARSEQALPESLPAWGGREQRSGLHLGGALRGLVAAVLTIAGITLLGLGLTTRWDDAGRHFVPRGDSAAAAILTALFNGVQIAWETAVRFLDPVTAAYGIGWTLGLLALLALASTWWMLSRN